MLDHQNTNIATTANDDNTAAQTSYFGTAGADAGNVRYDPFAAGQVSAAHGLEDIETIKPRSRDQYVELFKKAEERTAKATLRMCRVVYEAQQTLQQHEFADFCSTIGYKDTSSVIRKFCVIGKLQPRLVQHAAYMPHEWTKIYTLTQMPAQMFEQCVDNKTDFRSFSGKELKRLVNATQPATNKMSSYLPRDKDSSNFVFAKLTFDKAFVDAFDWRAVKKALAEVESRLPIKVQFVAAAEQAYQRTVEHRYTQSKLQAMEREFSPSKWDYGVEAAQDNLKDDQSVGQIVDASANETKSIE